MNLQKSLKNKIVLVALLLFLIVSNVSAYQETYRASSREYKDLMLLKTISGTSFPVMTTPVSGSQMLDLLHRVDYSKLSDYAKELYKNLENKLEKPEMLVGGNDVGFDFHPVINAQIWKNGSFSNDNGVVDQDSIVKYKDIKPFLEGDVTAYMSKYFAASVLLNATVSQNNTPEIGKSGVKYSLPFMFGRLSQDMPTKAYGSLGAAGLNLIIGRDRLSAGNGSTGNLILSENSLYNDFAKFSFVKSPISYDFTFIKYSPYENESSASGIGDPFKLKENTTYGGTAKNVAIHRFSAVLFKRVVLSAYEGAVVYGKGILSDLRMLNPFMYIHNSGSYYNGNTNNFAGLELTFPIVRGLEFDAQFLLDQYQLKTEKTVKAPNAWGILANVNGAWGLKKGVLSAYGEFCYGSSGLYLKELVNDYDKDGNKEYSKYYLIDLVGGMSHFDGSEFTYMGYPHGGDLKAAGIGSSYRTNKFIFDGSVFFKVKGLYGIEDNETRYLPYENDENRVNAYHLDFSVGCEALFIRGLKVKGILGFVNAWNYKHEKGRKSSDFQFSILCSLDVTDFVRGIKTKQEKCFL